MPGVKGVVGTLRPFREPADPPVGPEGVKPVPAPGNQLVRIGLMSHVPDDLVFRGIKDEVEGNGQLNSP